MNIYYASATGLDDVDGGDPVEADAPSTLAILRTLDVTEGFLGIVIDDELTLQFVPRDDGKYYTELLNSTNRTTFNALGQVDGKNASLTTASRFGPRHCGQSAVAD